MNPNTRCVALAKIAPKKAITPTNPNIRSISTISISSNEISSSTTHNVQSPKKKKQISWYDDNDNTRKICSYDLLIQFLLKDNGKEFDIYTGKLEGKKIEVISRAVRYFNEMGYTHRKDPSIKSKLETIIKTYTIANEKENSSAFREIEPSKQDVILEGICQGYKLIKQHMEDKARKGELNVLNDDRTFSIDNALEDITGEGESDVGSDGSGEEEQQRPKKKAKLSASDLNRNHIVDVLKVRQEMKREQYAHERKEAIRKIKMQLPEMLVKGISYDTAKAIVDDILLTYESEK